MVISAVAGMAGVGKTALAVQWAHRVAGRFPDGQLYVNLRGYGADGAAVTRQEVTGWFLAALGVPAARIPADAQARFGLYRSELAERRVLIVLDNARNAAQVRPLLPGGGGCLVVVTSRSALAGLAAAEGAQPLRLGPLTGRGCGCWRRGWVPSGWPPSPEPHPTGSASTPAFQLTKPSTCIGCMPRRITPKRS